MVESDCKGPRKCHFPGCGDTVGGEAARPLKLVQSLWRTVWRFLKKLEIQLPFDPAIPLLGIHTKEIRIERLQEQEEEELQSALEAADGETRSRGPPVPLPSIRVFSNESVLRIWWPKYWLWSRTTWP